MAADVVMQDLSSERWAHVDRLLDRKGPLATDAFVPGEPTKQMLRELLRVLVVGAGGLGCELLKDLTLMGFLNLDVIDMDRIEVTNLNRQFLFRKGDVGQPKAEVAAKFVNARIPGAHVTPHFAKIQDKDEEFYRQFHIIVLGLDSIEARRWMNNLVCSFLAYDDQGNLRPETSVPMVDGGTEGFKGHVRVIRPGISACFECTLDMFPPQVAFPLCTLAEIPRTPAHCIEWARIIRWGEVFPDKSLDLDDPDCMKWLYNTALGRAEEFGIQGVTYQLTQGVSKNIIPAIASTNAVVAGACANETFKLATGVCSTLDDYMMFMGATGLYTDVQKPERKEDCIACSNIPIRYTLSRRVLLDKLVSDSRAQCKAPSITSASRSLYLRGALEATTRANLALSVGELVAEEEALTVTDPVFHRGLQLRLRYTD